MTRNRNNFMFVRALRSFNDRPQLSSIIMDDESWVDGYDLETKPSFTVEESGITTTEEGKTGQEHRGVIADLFL